MKATTVIGVEWQLDSVDVVLISFIKYGGE